MLIDKYTISILESFSSLNPALLVREGNILTSGIPNIIKVSAVLDNSFPKRFALENVTKFIHILEIFKEPYVHFLDNRLLIYNGDCSFKLMYTDESIIEDLVVPDVNIELPSIDAIVNINAEVIAQLMKALRILGLSEIHFHGDGEFIFVSVRDSENPSSDSFTLKLGNFSRKFCAVFKAEYFNLYPADYEVSICGKGIAKFKSERLEYFIV